MFALLKDKVNTVSAWITVLVIIVLTVFCQVVQFSLILPLLLLFLGIHLLFFKKAQPRLLIQLGLLLTIIIFTAHALLRYTNIPLFYIPVASVAMLTMLLFTDLQLVFMMAFISSVGVGLVIGADLNTMLIFFIGSLTAAYAVRDARTRGTLITAGLYAGIIQAICVVLVNANSPALLTKGFLLHDVRPFIISGVLAGLVVSAVLKIFEYLFGVLTNFSLLELSDFNHPLLRRMILEAPGSYHHSLVVSNLAEAAADAIGANALLTRVGAYYHDIGKLSKPEYFTENQLSGPNKHDDIEPSVSRLVILNHVKEGVDLAKKYRLNPQIVDFIPQHHGTSLIHYFYQKALEDAENHEDVDEEQFRYQGPKPQSKETAIVLLADSVEGATRALEEQTQPRIEDVVRKVINNKFIDGQLDECNLTLKEIEVIAATFTRVLSAMYHSRIKYPEKKSENDN